jgi:uncharacterized OB-fold protein
MQLLQSISSQTNDFTISSFFKRLNEEGRLTGSICEDCGFKAVPPRPLCSRCLSQNQQLFDVPEEGKLVGFSEVHVSNDAFRDRVPYVVGIADFGNGVKIPGIIVNSNAKQLHVGDAVKIETKMTYSLPSLKAPQNSPKYWFRVPVVF